MLSELSVLHPAACRSRCHSASGGVRAGVTLTTDKTCCDRMDRRTRSLRISGSGLHDSYRQPWQSLSLEAARACDARARCVGWAREVWDPIALKNRASILISNKMKFNRGAPAAEVGVRDSTPTETNRTKCCISPVTSRRDNSLGSVLHALAPEASGLGTMTFRTGS